MSAIITVTTTFRKENRGYKKTEETTTKSNVSSYSTSTYMILIFQNFFKGSIQYLYNQFLYSVNLYSLRCPHCKHRGNFVFNGKYLRHCISLENKVIKEEFFYVQRVKCKQCHRTHALLPDCILPHHSYSYAFIMCVLGDYYIEKQKVCAICQQYQITHSLFYSWIRRFQKHKIVAALVQQLSSQKEESILQEIQRVSLPVFLKSFFDEHQFPYLHFIETYHPPGIGTT